MSTDYGCALGGPDHKVSWLITHLQPAMTISLCDEDFPVGVIPLLASELGVDPGRLYDSVKRFVDGEQAREAHAAAKAAAAAAAGAPPDITEPAQITAVLGPDGRDSGQTIMPPVERIEGDDS